VYALGRSAYAEGANQKSRRFGYSTVGIVVEVIIAKIAIDIRGQNALTKCLFLF
jgi:hypothetical protein